MGPRVSFARAALVGLAPLGLACGVAPAQGAPGPDGGAQVHGELRARYGFAGFEVIELDEGVAGLVAGDVDGDGVLDLAVSNPARSRVEVLLRLPPDAPDAVDPERDEDEPNPIVFDRRYRRVLVPLERRLLAHALGDVDGDGRDELVCALDGGRLRVVAQLTGETGPVSSEREVDELREGCELLRCLDLDADGRQDVVAATEDVLFWLPSGPDGPEGRARVLDHAPEGVEELALHDLDGDGRRDLVSLHLARDNPFRYRLGTAAGVFGPRTDLDGAPIRSGTVADLDGDGRPELLAVGRLSGRLGRWAVERSEAEPAVHRYSLRPQPEGREARTFGVGDLDGDGTDDVAFASPELAELSLFYGTRGGWLRRTDSPGLVASADPRVADLDGDGRAELVTISRAERMIGVTRPDADGSLPFPATTPLEGEPVAMDVADVDGDGLVDVVLVVSKGEGRGRTHELQVWSGGASGLAAEPALRQEIEDLRKVPEALLARDVSRDGRTDVVLFMPGSSEVPRFLVQREDGGFASDRRGEDIPGLGILAGVGPARVSPDGEEVLVAARHFVRALHFRLDQDGRLVPVVGEQTNSRSSRVQAAACATLDVDGDGSSEILLLDGATKELLVLERDGAAAGGDPVAVRGLGERGLVPADVDGDGHAELLLFAPDGLGVLAFASRGLVLRELASYEPAKAGLRLDALATGDLDHDGRPDVAVAETTRHALVILRPDEAGFERALGFRVFEEHTFTSAADAGEPREILAGRLDADDKDDLAVLVHDKLILYLQE